MVGSADFNNLPEIKGKIWLVCGKGQIIAFF